MSVRAKANYEDVIKRFQNILDLTQDFKPLFTKIVGRGENPEPWTLRGSAKFSLENEISPKKNKSFKELKPKYKSWKDRNFSSDLTILHLTGRLYESLVYKSSDSVVIQNPTKLIYGTKVPYAAAHQYGYTKNKLPKRPYLGFRKNQKLRIQLEIRKYIVNVYKRKQRIESGGGE